MSEVTRILTAIDQGDAKAAEELFPLVYEELRRLAAQKMASQPPGHTLQTTALVHEAWLRLGGPDQQTWHTRAHFYSAAAEAMRNILIDRARRKQAAKHGGGLQRVDIADTDIAAPDNDDQLLAVHEALDRLAKVSEPKAEL